MASEVLKKINSKLKSNSDKQTKWKISFDNAFI